MNQQSIHDRIMSRGQGNDAVQTAVIDQPAPKPNWWKTAALSLLGIAVVGVGGYAAIHYGAVQNLVSKPAVAETNDADLALPDSPFLQHAKQAGLQACSTMFPVLGEMLTAGTQYNVQSSWNDETPDEHAVQALVGMEFAGEQFSGSAAGVVFAAPTGATCEGAMVRVTPFSTPCADIRSILPQGSKLANNLGKVAVYELGGNGGNALLLPAANTCVVISVASVVH